MTKTTKYPLDFAALNSGDIITFEEIEAAIHYSPEREPEKFHQYAWYFSNEVTHRLRREGKVHQQNLKALYSKSAGILILSGEQHKEYGHRVRNKSIRGVMRGVAELQLVNRLELTDSSRRDLDRLIDESSLIVGSILNARRTFRLSKPNNPMRIAAQEEDQP